MGECKVLQRIGDGITGLLVDCGTGFTSVLPSTIMSATATDYKGSGTHLKGSPNIWADGGGKFLIVQQQLPGCRDGRRG